MIRSIQFPKMFGSASTKLVSDRAATSQNLKTLLMSEKTSFFGDPYFGTNIKRLIFEQNNQILRDIVIDDIYTSIATFLPQVRVKRSDIELNSDGTTLYVSIKAQNLLDFNMETINLALFNIEELE